MKGNRPESVRLRQKPGFTGQLQLDNDMGAWDPSEVPRFQDDCLQTDTGSNGKRGEAYSG